MSLKEQLFPDTNITGYTDRNNQPILVGQSLRDETTVLWDVVYANGKYGVLPHRAPYVTSYPFIEIGLFVTMSSFLEIVLPADEPDTAPVAMAPFNKEHNRSVPVKSIKKGRRLY